MRLVTEPGSRSNFGGRCAGLQQADGVVQAPLPPQCARAQAEPALACACRVFRADTASRGDLRNIDIIVRSKHGRQAHKPIGGSYGVYCVRLLGSRTRRLEWAAPCQRQQRPRVHDFERAETVGGQCGKVEYERAVIAEVVRVLVPLRMNRKHTRYAAESPVRAGFEIRTIDNKRRVGIGVAGVFAWTPSRPQKFSGVRS